MEVCTVGAVVVMGNFDMVMKMTNLYPKKIETFTLLGKKIVKISGKGSHYLAQSDDGELFGWGFAGSGRLGLGNDTDQYVPTKIPFFEGKNIVLFTCGLDHSFVVTEE